MLYILIVLLIFCYLCTLPFFVAYTKISSCYGHWGVWGIPFANIVWVMAFGSVPPKLLMTSAGGLLLGFVLVSTTLCSLSSSYYSIMLYSGFIVFALGVVGVLCIIGLCVKALGECAGEGWSLLLVGWCSPVAGGIIMVCSQRNESAGNILEYFIIGLFWTFLTLLWSALSIKKSAA